MTEFEKIKTPESREVIKVPSVQTVLLRQGPQEVEVYLGRRSAGGFLNQWSVPGGKMDEGETAPQAACRELKEETGLTFDESDLILLREDSSSTVREKEGKTATYEYEFKIYVVFAQGQEPKNASPDEYSETGWVTVSRALEMDRAARAEVSGLEPDQIPGALTPRVADTMRFLEKYATLEDLQSHLKK